VPLAFHPAAWWTRREIARTREMACDEMVVERLLEPGVYAQSILQIASRAGGVRAQGYALGAFDGDILEERIRRLLTRPAASLRRARLMLAAGVSALAACVVIASGLAISARAQSAAQPEMKLGATAFNRGDYPGAAVHFERAVAIDPVTPWRDCIWRTH
jgi:beta-lactamase regulating signal transducer with metallopeptidase domain